MELDKLEGRLIDENEIIHINVGSFSISVYDIDRVHIMACDPRLLEDVVTSPTYKLAIIGASALQRQSVGRSGKEINVSRTITVTLKEGITEREVELFKFIVPDYSMVESVEEVKSETPRKAE